MYGGTAVAVPPPFRPSDPALCGICPLVPSYYRKLGDLLYIICVVSFVLIIVHVYVRVKLFTFFDLYFVYFLQYSDTVGWVFWPVKTVGLYCVGADLKPCSTNTAKWLNCVFKCTRLGCFVAEVVFVIGQRDDYVDLR